MVPLMKPPEHLFESPPEHPRDSRLPGMTMNDASEDCGDERLSADAHPSRGELARHTTFKCVFQEPRSRGTVMKEGGGGVQFDFNVIVPIPS